MSDAFTVFVRHEEKVLLMQRADEVADLPGAWDGVYGYGDHNNLDTVISRIVESTGIPADKLQHVRTGESRGIAMGNTLLEVTPILFVSESNVVTPKTLYKNPEWVDPGMIGKKEYSTPSLRDMYGDVASFLYILKNKYWSRAECCKGNTSFRLSGSGSLMDIQDEIYGVLSPNYMKGYIFVEASAFHHVEKLIGRAGVSTTPIKNCRKVLDGESPLEDVLPYLEPKAATTGIEEGCIVEIHGGAFRGQSARVIRVTESKEEVTVELFEAAVPVALTVRADQVRVTQRVE